MDTIITLTCRLHGLEWVVIERGDDTALIGCTSGCGMCVDYRAFKMGKLHSPHNASIRRNR